MLGEAAAALTTNPIAAPSRSASPLAPAAPVLPALPSAAPAAAVLPALPSAASAVPVLLALPTADPVDSVRSVGVDPAPPSRGC